jgi:hypothetical protein
MSVTFDERFERLLSEMEHLAAMLSEHGETHWAEWIRRDRVKIARHQRHGLDSLLSAFGGMGSLSDVVIHPGNGHSMELDEAARVNKRLTVLRSAVHRDASALRRALG